MSDENVKCTMDLANVIDYGITDRLTLLGPITQEYVSTGPSTKNEKPEISLAEKLAAAKRIFAQYDTDKERDSPDIIMLVNEATIGYFKGTILKCVYRDNDYVYVSFIADCYVKFDGCSNFYYYGEDVMTKESDSYYHVCGPGGYATMIDIQLFVLHIAKKLFEEQGSYDSELLRSEYINKLLDTYYKYASIDENPPIKLRINGLVY